MALTAAEQAELAALEAEFGSAPATPTSGLTPAEQEELAALEAEFGQAPAKSGLTDAEKAELDQLENEFRIIDSPLNAYSDEDLQRIRETGIDSPVGTPDENLATLSNTFKRGLAETDVTSSSRRAAEARLKADAATILATRAAEAAKPNMAEDILLGAGSGVMNAITGTGAIIAGAPGSISNAINAPDLEEFKQRYAPGSFKDYTDADVIRLYNQEQAKAGLPSYEEQLSSMPTITDALQWTRDNITKGTVGEYEPQTLPGQVAETAGGLATFGGVGGKGAQVATRLTGAALGAEAADQLTKDVDNPWVRGGAQITGAVLGGGVGGLVTGIDDAARAASLRGSLEQTRIATRDAATRAAGLRQNFNAIMTANGDRVAQFMSAARVYTGLGRDQSLVSASNLARTALTRGPAALASGGLSEAATFALGVGGRMLSSAKANPAIQQTLYSGVRTAPASSGVAITSQGGQVVEEPSDIVPLTAQ